MRKVGYFILSFPFFIDWKLLLGGVTFPGLLASLACRPGESPWEGSWVWMLAGRTLLACPKIERAEGNWGLCVMASAPVLSIMDQD